MQPTKKQKAVMDLRDHGNAPDPTPMPWKEVADALGMTPQQAARFYRAGQKRVKKTDHDPFEKTAGGDQNATGRIIATYGDPGVESMVATAAEEGVHKNVVVGIRDKMIENYPMTLRSVEAAHTSDLKKLLSANSKKLLESIHARSADDLSAEGVKDLAVATGIMLEKLTLLDKNATEEITEEDRRHFGELLVAMKDEIIRRGLDAQVDPVDQSVSVTDGDLDNWQRNKLSEHQEERSKLDLDF